MERDDIWVFFFFYLIVFPGLGKGHFLRDAGGLVSDQAGDLLALIDDPVDGGLVGPEPWQDDGAIDLLGSLEGRHAPDEEDALGEPVEGDPAHQDVGEKLQDGEASEDHPVHQPLRVVILVPALQGLDRAVSGVEEADEVAQQGRAVAEHQPTGGEADETVGQVVLLDAHLALQHGQVVVHCGVLEHQPIEPVHHGFV